MKATVHGDIEDRAAALCMRLRSVGIEKCESCDAIEAALLAEHALAMAAVDVRNSRIGAYGALLDAAEEFEAVHGTGPSSDAPWVGPWLRERAKALDTE